MIELVLNNKLTIDVVHIRRLKPYFQRDNSDPSNSSKEKESTELSN